MGRLAVSDGWLQAQLTAHRLAPYQVPPLAQRELAEFVAGIRHDWGRPDHLTPYLDVWRRIDEGEAVRVLLSVPPRHWKSQTTLCGLARHIARRPDLRNAYVTYGDNLTRGGSRTVRRYVQESLAIPASGDANRLDEWLTQYGGGLYATSVGGGLTGKGIDGVAVVDDPIKNREEAESPRIREKIASWFGDVVMTRLERNASVIVIMTRWHPGDLIGELSGTGDWETINIPALRTDADGVERALLPAYPDGAPAYPVARLHELRRQLGDYSFASLYQGMPRPRGGTVFGEATTCALADVPSQGRDFIGVDLAYTARTHADWSTAVVLRTQRYKDDEGARRTRCWVVDVLRRQERASDFVRRLQHLERAHPGAPMVWHGSTTERGGADAIRELGLPQLRPMLATGDKFVRSQPVAAAWNAGDVWVPRDAPWSTAFLDEVQSFTGVGDRTDDQVDALASAFSSVATTPSSDIKTGRRAKFGRSARSAF